ncbi:phospholipase-like protein, partial [Tanacetum coccineum]
DLSRCNISIDNFWLSEDLDLYLRQLGLLRCRFKWCNDRMVNRKFWESLVCLDPPKKGWLLDDHIDLWVEYMWHVRPKSSDWAIVSSYFVQLLLQDSMPNWYANGQTYNLPWSVVDQVLIPLNEPGQGTVYRIVSKTWKSIIDSTDFVVSYGARPSQPASFLVTYDQEESAAEQEISDEADEHKISDEANEHEISDEYLTEEQQQLLQDEEALRETLEEKERHEKVYGRQYYACPSSKLEIQDRGCRYFMWKNDLRLCLSYSPGPSTPSSSSTGPSTPPSPSRFVPNHGKLVCLNCKFLAERIKTLEAKIKILKGTLEMERHPENHTFDSTIILYELYNDMGRFGLE